MANSLNHVAIIMDGNGRWAQQRQLERLEGHLAGVEVAKTAVEFALEAQIPCLSLFAFSSENWRRPSDEVDGLMKLLSNTLSERIDELNQQQVSLRFVGDLSRLSQSLQTVMAQAQHITQHNQTLKLIIALNYGGHWDIVQAVKKMIARHDATELRDESLIQAHLERYLSTATIPPPDLLIRTSGEYRISNFFLWQLAYTELYFCKTLWPDFNKDEFSKALDAYHQRQRRYGVL